MKLKERHIIIGEKQNSHLYNLSGRTYPDRILFVNPNNARTTIKIRLMCKDQERRIKDVELLLFVRHGRFSILRNGIHVQFYHNYVRLLRKFRLIHSLIEYVNEWQLAVEEDGMSSTLRENANEPDADHTGPLILGSNQ